MVPPTTLPAPFLKKKEAFLRQQHAECSNTPSNSTTRLANFDNLLRSTHTGGLPLSKNMSLTLKKTYLQADTELVTHSLNYPGAKNTPNLFSLFLSRTNKAKTTDNISPAPQNRKISTRLTQEGTLMSKYFENSFLRISMQDKSMVILLNANTARGG
jgi:hypothetical protein